MLHVAAEFGILEAARLLLDRGADVDARASGVDAAGVGGKRPCSTRSGGAGHKPSSFATCSARIGAPISRNRRCASRSSRWRDGLVAGESGQLGALDVEEGLVAHWCTSRV